MVDFAKGLKTLQETEAVKRHPELPKDKQTPDRPSGRAGKVSITQWVDPMVRKQVQQLVLDVDKDQYVLVNEALNLLFEKYGKPQIA